MKLLNILKKLVGSVTGKRKADNAYLGKDVRIHAGPGDNNTFQSRRRRLERLKQRILAKRHRTQDGYSNKPAGRKNMPAWLGGTILLACLALLIWGFGGKVELRQRLQSIAFFKVARIEFSGCSTVSRERLAEASGIILHQTSLFGLDTSQVETGLVAVPWVEKAVVKRNWPSTIEIAIKENIPVAILHTPEAEDAQLHYIDDKGARILPVSPGADIDFPVITGLLDIADEQQRGKSIAEALIFLKKVQINDPHLPAQSVSEIHLNQAGEIVVYMVEYPFPIFFGNGNTRQNYSRLIQVLRAIYKKPNGKELLSGIEYIQMDYLNDKVLVAQGGSGL
jgi:cell division protein FtsQ